MSIRLPHLALLAALAAPAVAVTATQDVQVFGGNDERAGSSLVFFGQGPLGMVGVQYGQPVWNDGYDERFDSLKGKDLRLGMNNWTVMNTDVPLTFGETRIEPGMYFLGLRCDDEGGFHLLAFEGAAATKKKLAPYMAHLWGDADVVVPLERGAAAERHEKLTITLASDPGGALSFAIAWGTHELKATGTVELR